MGHTSQLLCRSSQYLHQFYKSHMLAAGLLAFIAQAKYDSFILEVITVISATSLLSRVVLGYWRLAQR